MLGVEMPAVEDAVRSVESLQRPDGGYAELAGQTASQTSATAAASAFLLMQDALPPERSARAADFLTEMQGADGGLRPHAAVHTSDLLSTFTGLLTLSGLRGLKDIDVRAAARFLRGGAPRRWIPLPSLRRLARRRVHLLRGRHACLIKKSGVRS